MTLISKKSELAYQVRTLCGPDDLPSGESAKIIVAAKCSVEMEKWRDFCSMFSRVDKVNLEVRCHARSTIPRGKVNKNERPPVCWN